MSHYLCYVFLPELDNLQQRINRLLAPYNEADSPDGLYDYYTVGDGFASDAIAFSNGSRTSLARVSSLPAHPERPFAMVTSDGEWDSCGRPGWFGTSDATDDSIRAFEQRFWDYCTTHPDEWMIAVNCHI